jgi:hypothetical protein
MEQVHLWPLLAPLHYVVAAAVVCTMRRASLVQSAAADIALLAEARRAQRAAGGGEPLENRGNEAGAEGRAPSPPAPAATLVLGG